MGMRSMTKSHLLSACLLIVTSYTAEAVSVKYTLNDVVFNDGGAANGSFVYDADTNLYSNIAIETTAGTILEGAIYPDFLRGSAVLLDVVPDASLTNLTGSLLLNINFA